MNISRTTSNEPEPRLRRSEHVKRLFLGGLLAATTLAGGLAFTFSTVSADQPEFICDGYADGTEKINTVDDPATVPYTAPDGFLVDEYCVKASTVMVIVPVNPPSKTVTIDHPTVDSVSHYSVSWTPACEFDPTIPASSEDCREKPDAKVTESDWVDGTYECGATIVLQTRTVTTTPYVYEDGDWVPDTKNAVAKNESQERKLTASEIKVCPTTTPPAAPPTQIQVASNAPTAPAAAAPAAATPAAAAPATPISTQLPSTGSSSWVTALIALVTLAGGTGLVRLSRRPTD